MYEKQFSHEGFEWINYGDADNSVLAYMRKGLNEKDDLIIVANFTPVVHQDYRIGIPKKGNVQEIFNSDDTKYQGSGMLNSAKIKIEATPWNGREFSAAITLPPLAISVFKWVK